jgi:hypothetical protein
MRGQSFDAIKLDFHDHFMSVFQHGDPAHHIWANTLQYLGSNRILRFENIEADYQDLCEHLGLEQNKLPKLKTQARLMTEPYQKYYSLPMTLVMDQYIEPIIENFGYSYDSP